jgi:hypothetical protein
MHTCCLERIQSGHVETAIARAVGGDNRTRFSVFVIGQLQHEPLATKKKTSRWAVT